LGASDQLLVEHDPVAGAEILDPTSTVVQENSTVPLRNAFFGRKPEIRCGGTSEDDLVGFKTPFLKRAILWPETHQEHTMMIAQRRGMLKGKWMTRLGS
jgi:hypothetical protein